MGKRGEYRPPSGEKPVSFDVRSMFQTPILLGPSGRTGGITLKRMRTSPFGF